MNKLTMVVAIYKNEKNIIPFYEDFCINIKPHLDDYEIIMVNDASPDNSWKVMKEVAKRDHKIKLVRLARNFGAIAASFTGIKYATGDCVTVKACDLQEPPELTIDMYNRWKDGAGTVIAVREGRDDPLISRVFSAAYYKLIRIMVNEKMPRGGFDTYLIDREVANIVVEMSDRNSPITIQLLWLGQDIQEVYYVRRKRQIGKSSWTFSKKMKLFVDSFMGFSYIPIRCMSTVGLCFAVFALIWGIKVSISRLMGRIDVRGYTAIFVLVLFSAGLIMFSLGILGEYLWRTFDAVRKRPMTIIAEKVNFEEDKIEN